MDDEVSEKTVNIVISTTRITFQTITNGIRLYLARHSGYAEQQQGQEELPRKRGKQTVKELMQQDQGVKTIEVNDAKIRELERLMRKNGIDFAITKNRKTKPPRFLVFFKAKDEDVLHAVLSEMVGKQIHGKTSVRDQIRKAKTIPDRNRVRNRQPER